MSDPYQGQSQPGGWSAAPPPAPPQPPPYGWTPPPWQPPPGPKPNHAEGLALAAVLIGAGSLLMPLPPVSITAIVLGAIARRRLPKGARRRGGATAGIVLGIVSLMFFAGLITFFVIDEARHDDVAFDDVNVGDCIDSEIGAWTVRLQDCAGPHDSEAFATAEYPSRDGAGYPGDTEVEDWATERCLDAFEAYVGIPYDESEFDAYPIVPTKDGWSQGNRTIVCVIEPTGDEPLVGSVRGSGR